MLQYFKTHSSVLSVGPLSALALELPALEAAMQATFPATAGRILYVISPAGIKIKFQRVTVKVKMSSQVAVSSCCFSFSALRLSLRGPLPAFARARARDPGCIACKATGGLSSNFKCLSNQNCQEMLGASKGSSARLAALAAALAY